MKDTKARTAALILNGRYIPPGVRAGYVLCADGGYNLARKAGLSCDAVIGDMDSASGLDPGVRLITFEREKNETDGELAVLYLINAGYKDINIYGALGGRPDHVAANVNLLALASQYGARAVICDDGVEIHFITGSLEAACVKGDIISVLPYTGSVTFEESRGLLYPLKGLTIEKHSSRGISNVATEDKVLIIINEGEAYVYRISSTLE